MNKRGADPRVADKGLLWSLLVIGFLTVSFGAQAVAVEPGYGKKPPVPPTPVAETLDNAQRPPLPTSPQDLAVFAIKAVGHSHADSVTGQPASSWTAAKAASSKKAPVRPVNITQPVAFLPQQEAKQIPKVAKKPFKQARPVVQDATTPESPESELVTTETLLLPETDEAALLQSESDTVLEEGQDVPLETVFAQNRERQEEFLSSDYLMKVGGLVVLLLGAFYVFARTVLSRWFPGTRQTADAGFTPAKPKKAPSVLDALMPPKGPFEWNDVKPRVLSRTQLGSAREIVVLQVGKRQLVVGVTPQQMTLLTELDEEPGTVVSPETEMALSKSFQQGEGATYKKYLFKPPQQSMDKSFSLIPEQEEVFLLDDYEDQFER